MNSKPENNNPSKSGGLLAGGGALSGLAALIGAPCCVLPIVLVNLGLSSAFVGNLAFFARAKPYFLGAAVLFIAVSFAAAFWRGRRPAGRTLALLVAGAYILAHYEPQILRWLNLR